MIRFFVKASAIALVLGSASARLAGEFDRKRGLKNTDKPNTKVGGTPGAHANGSISKVEVPIKAAAGDDVAVYLAENVPTDINEPADTEAVSSEAARTSTSRMNKNSNLSGKNDQHGGKHHSSSENDDNEKKHTHHGGKDHQDGGKNGNFTSQSHQGEGGNSTAKEHSQGDHADGYMDQKASQISALDYTVIEDTNRKGQTIVSGILFAVGVVFGILIGYFARYWQKRDKGGNGFETDVDKDMQMTEVANEPEKKESIDGPPLEFFHTMLFA